MSDTTEPRDISQPEAPEPLNDSAELRDAIRSIEAIGEDRTGAEASDDTTSAPDSDAPEVAAADSSERTS